MAGFTGIEPRASSSALRAGVAAETFTCPSRQCCADGGPPAGSAGVDDAVVKALWVERTDSPRDAMREERGTNDNSVRPTEMPVIMPSEPYKVDDTGDDDPERTRAEETMHAGTFQ